MKYSRSLVAMMMIAASVAACADDDNGTDPDPSDLAGTYTVQTFEYVSDENSAIRFDLATVSAAQGGPWGITEMTVQADGSFAGELTIPEQGVPTTYDIGGDIEVLSDNELRIDFDADTDNLGILDDFEDGTYDLDGNTLTIVLPDVTFDFDQDGEDSPADLTIVGTR